MNNEWTTRSILVNRINTLMLNDSEFKNSVSVYSSLNSIPIMDFGKKKRN